MIRFDVPGPPVVWKRAQGRNRFTDPVHKSQAETIKVLARQAGVRPSPLPVPMALRVIAYLPRPKVPAGPFPVGKRSGDVDNYLKLVADALEGIAYENDSQIIDGQEIKLYAPGEPYTRIIVGIAGTVPTIDLS